MSKETSPGLGQMRIPDILETIADLSNDEVFTPPELANKVLDMLPESIWTDSSVTFLDPASKTGVFLREITKRLIAGLEHEFPDLQERVNHILTKQVYGLGLTKLTSLMSRRTVYCSTTANGIKSVCTDFEDSEGNIKFPESKHTFNKNGKCTVCGAGEDLYYEEEGLDNYAYSFLHDNMEEVFGDVKFDVIIGNPPYQLSDGGGASGSSIPLYNKFIEKALELKPKYVSMIVPSRWMIGGRGLDKFREKMISDTRIKKIVDYEMTSDVFYTQGFDGGVMYFLLDEDYSGKVDYTYQDKNGNIQRTNRSLKNELTDTVIRDYRRFNIIKKAKSLNEKNFDVIVSSRSPFGYSSDLLNDPKKYNITTSKNKKEGSVRFLGLIGGIGSGKRSYRYTERENVVKGKESIDKYKLFFSKAFNLKMTVPPEIVKGEPLDVCTETFLKIGDFDTQEERDNCLSYMKTKFFRALFYYKRHSLNTTSSTFSLIPLQDFSKPWTDEELYKKYKLTKEEIAYIEENIAEMN